MASQIDIDYRIELNEFKSYVSNKFSNIQEGMEKKFKDVQEKQENRLWNILYFIGTAWAGIATVFFIHNAQFKNVNEQYYAQLIKSLEQEKEVTIQMKNLANVIKEQNTRIAILQTGNEKIVRINDFIEKLEIIN